MHTNCLLTPAGQKPSLKTLQLLFWHHIFFEHEREHLQRTRENKLFTCQKLSKEKWTWCLWTILLIFLLKRLLFFSADVILIPLFFFLHMHFLHGMFGNNKSVLEMSTCQNKTAGSQLIFRLVIPKACSDTEKQVTIWVNWVGQQNRFKRRQTLKALRQEGILSVTIQFAIQICTEPYLLVWLLSVWMDEGQANVFDTAEVMNEVQLKQTVLTSCHYTSFLTNLLLSVKNNYNIKII